ncbi:MAG: nucleotidyl transferase AbiEii/AbiGii toxin family protein, partial [Candidatus Pacearchaeota archaeon]
EELILEKVSAFLKRRKIRDLYDIYFLLNYAKREEKVIISLNGFIKNFKNPLDEENLKVIIISGVTPNSKELLEAIKKWVK